MLLTYTLIKCKLSWPFSDLGWIRKGAFHSKPSSTLNSPQIWRVIVRDNKLWIQFACWAISQKGKMLYLCEKAYHITIVKTQCQCDVTKNTHLSKGTLTLFKMPKMETQMSLSPPPCRINSMIHLVPFISVRTPCLSHLCHFCLFLACRITLPESCQLVLDSVDLPMQ